MRRFVYVWEFEVQPQSRSEFLRHYGPCGTWAELFARAAGYVETILLEDQSTPIRFVTIDRWTSKKAHEAFLREHRAEYERTDRLCGSLTSAEKSLGSYWEVTADAGAA